MTDDFKISLSDGGFINARVEGPEDAPWIVFSNSVLTDLHVWEGQVGELSRRFRVVRYDQRGHGLSALPHGPMDFSRYGSDLLALISNLGILRCTVVGLSMGVPTALAAYALAPDRFEGFVAVDGVAQSAPEREAFWTERRAFARINGMSAIASGTANRWLPASDSQNGGVSTLTAMIAATPVAGFAAATHALQRYDLSDVVSRIVCPFLGIAGAQDGSMPEAMRAQFAEVPGAEFAIIPGAGHVPNFQSPDAFNATLLSFLDRVATQTKKEMT